MDPPDQEPERGNAAIAQLNTYLTGRVALPLVVTCRGSYYKRLRERIRPTATITIQPLTERQVNDYLDREYLLQGDALGRQAWQKLLSQFSDSQRKRLLDVLATPWCLTLAVAYQRDSGTLADLLGPSEQEAPVGQRCPDAEGDDKYRERVTAGLLGPSFQAALTCTVMAAIHPIKSRVGVKPSPNTSEWR